MNTSDSIESMPGERPSSPRRWESPGWRLALPSPAKSPANRDTSPLDRASGTGYIAPGIQRNRERIDEKTGEMIKMENPCLCVECTQDFLFTANRNPIPDLEFFPHPLVSPSTQQLYTFRALLMVD